MSSRDFSRFRTGQFLAILGGRCCFLSLSWWTLASTGSTYYFTQLAIVFSIVGFVSLPLLALLADRWPRKWCAVVADLWTLGGIVALYLVTRGGIYRPAEAMVIVGFLALGVSLMTAVSGSIVPMLVERKEIGRAYASIGSLQALTLLAAPPLAGYAASSIGLPMTLLLNGMLLLVTLYCTMSIRTNTHPGHGGDHTSIEGWGANLIDGLRLATRIRPELAWNLVGAAINGCVVPFGLLLVPLIVLRDLDLGMAVTGWLTAATATGLLVGSRIAPWLAQRVIARHATVVGVALIGAGVSVYTAATSAWLLALGSLASGFGMGLHNVYCASYRSAATPDAYRGRLVAWGKWSAQASVPVGLLFFGALVQYLPPTMCVLLVASVVFASAAVLAVTPSVVELLRGTVEERHDYYLSRYPSAFGPVK